MNLSTYAEDSAKQESGSPCHLDDSSINVKRVGTASFNGEIETIKRNLYGFAPNEVDHNLVMAHWLAEYGVTGWDGIFGDEGKELIFNKQNALSVFLNPAYHMSLNTILINHGSDYNNYLFDEIERDIEQTKKS